MTQNNTNTFKVSLKTTTNEVIQVDATSSTTVLQLKTKITQKNGHPEDKIKLVYKGKIIDDHETMANLQIKEAATIMVVLRKAEKKDPQTQGINPNLSNIQTGLGDFNPVGFGNFGLVNQPGYMSALSSVASPEKMEEMMDDPFYQKMIEEMLNDPEIMIKAMETSPQLKQMVDSNPMLKMMMSNPELMKVIMSPQNMKMAMEVQKNGGFKTQPTGSNQGFMGGGSNGFGGMAGINVLGSNPFASMGGFNNNPFFGTLPQNLPSLNSLSSTGTKVQQSNTNQVNQSVQPNQQQQNNQPNAFSNPFASPAFSNPMFNSLFNPGFSPMWNSAPMQNPFTQVPQQNLEQKYKNELSTLESMGFTDKVKNIEALQICLGNVQAAVERLLK